MTVLESEALIITSLYPLAEHLRRDYWQLGAADADGKWTSALHGQSHVDTCLKELQLAFFAWNRFRYLLVWWRTLGIDHWSLDSVLGRMQAEVINLLPVATEAASANFAFQLTAVFVLWIFSQSAVLPPRAFTPSTKVFIMRLAVYFKNPSVTLTSHHVRQRSSRIGKALRERWEQTFGTVTKDVTWCQSDSCGLFEWVLVKFSREAQFCFSLLSLIKSHSWRQALSS